MVGEFAETPCNFCKKAYNSIWDTPGVRKMMSAAEVCFGDISEKQAGTAAGRVCFSDVFRQVPQK
ncbi:hypothetical protein RUMCAL_01797 [Ruminococcus callidus ATCC 27760]|uniref:Uncharacterized protein n=1 Tax=Ruminococcus callidus ATCC 27760 TaxID=411473 RepID=U2LZJ0_9FIRM|nr:hypothetical protein RUMCAL_01797 [Ruminococcus callidus ATCC 27760]